MVSKLILNKTYKRGQDDEVWIQFKSQNPNINFYKLHECNINQFYEAINDLRKSKEYLPELPPISKIQNSEYDIDEYFKYLTKDVINDLQFQKFMTKCSSQRKNTYIQKLHGNPQLPTILEGMQESASQRINVGEEDDGLLRRHSSNFYQSGRLTPINQSIKNSIIQYDITKSEIGQSKYTPKSSQVNQIINENVIF